MSLFNDYKPLSPYCEPESTVVCACSSEEDYINFLIGEYGAEKVLRVQKEQKEAEERIDSLFKMIRETIRKL